MPADAAAHTALPSGQDSRHRYFDREDSQRRPSTFLDIAGLGSDRLGPSTGFVDQVRLFCFR